MSDGTKKVEETEQKVKSVELSEQDLDSIAGGVVGSPGYLLNSQASGTPAPAPQAPAKTQS